MQSVEFKRHCGHKSAVIFRALQQDKAQPDIDSLPFLLAHLAADMISSLVVAGLIEESCKRAGADETQVTDMKALAAQFTTEILEEESDYLDAKFGPKE